MSHRNQAALVFMALAFAACRSTVGCPEGMILNDDNSCRLDIPHQDGGPSDGGDAGEIDAGHDAGSDAGPCDGQCDLEHCIDGACVHCTEATSNVDCGDEAFCVEHECVECRTFADCGEPNAPACVEGTCVPCTEHEQCAGRADTPVCNGGECVECTLGATSACAGKPCTIANTCSAFGDGEQRACEPCDTDDNCAPDHYCVPMKYDGADRPGGYCLKTTTGLCEQPFSITTMARTTLSGAEGITFCGINETLTTCEAVRALLDNVLCGRAEDPPCPEGGICRQVGDLTPNRCTYECSEGSQCTPPPGAGSTCGDRDGSGSNYCGGGN